MCNQKQTPAVHIPYLQIFTSKFETCQVRVFVFFPKNCAISCLLAQDVLAPLPPPAEGQAPMESEVPEDAMERLAHLEQLVVQLKGLVRDKDAQLVLKDTELSSKDAQLKVAI